MQPVGSPEMWAVIKERDQLKDQLDRAANGVTVAIPCYNQADSLAMALGSAIAQSIEPYEIIVIDDGSTATEGQKIENLCGDYIQGGSPITYMRITNRGLPSARNAALMATSSFAFLPLDADDYLDQLYIERTLPHLKDAEVVLTGLQEHGPTRNGTYMPGYDRPFDQVDEEILWQYNRFFYCSLFRTDALRAVGGYNSRMAGGWGVNGGYEDWDLWIDFKRRGFRFAAVNEILFNYTTKPDGMLSQAEQNRGVLVDEMRRHHER